VATVGVDRHLEDAVAIPVGAALEHDAIQHGGLEVGVVEDPEQPVVHVALGGLGQRIHLDDVRVVDEPRRALEASDRDLVRRGAGRLVVEFVDGDGVAAAVADHGDHAGGVEQPQGLRSGERRRVVVVVAERNIELHVVTRVAGQGLVHLVNREGDGVTVQGRGGGARRVDERAQVDRFDGVRSKGRRDGRRLWCFVSAPQTCW